MSLTTIARKLAAVTTSVEELSRVEGTQERLALTGLLALEALGANQEHTSPREAADTIAQYRERSAEYDRSEKITRSPRPGCQMLSEGDECGCGLCERDREIHRLWGMINKLPKCWRIDDDGHLFQDQIVLPGMKLWSGGIGGPQEIEVLSLEDLDSPWCATIRMGVGGSEPDRGGEYNWAVRNCYSTREAVEAAKEKGHES